MAWERCDVRGSALKPAARVSITQRRITLNTLVSSFFEGCQFVHCYLDVAEKLVCIEKLNEYEDGAVKLQNRGKLSKLRTITNTRLVRRLAAAHGVRDGERLFLVRCDGNEAVFQFGRKQ